MKNYTEQLEKQVQEKTIIMQELIQERVKRGLPITFSREEIISRLDY